MIDDLFPDLPFDNEKPAKPFRPYKDYANNAWRFLKENASILGLALATAVFLA